MSHTHPEAIPKVFVHVGAPKTGTTFIQEILWANRERLKEDRILLPGSRVSHFHATLDVREVPLDRHPPSAANSWNRLADEARKWTGNVIISHELFAGASYEQAQRALAALAPAEVHIVYTARDLARQVPAEWQEHVKHRDHLQMDEFVDEVISGEGGSEWFWRVQDPANVIDRWGWELPRERIHLVTVPPAGTDLTALWSRFAGLVGIDPDAYDVSAVRSNVSLSPAESEFLRRVNIALGERLSQPGAYPRFVKEVLAHQTLGARPGKEKFGMRPERNQWLRQCSAELMERIRASEVDIIGDLAELQPAEQGPGGKYPDDVTDAEVAAVSTDAVVTLLERVRKHALRAESAERRLAELEQRRWTGLRNRVKRVLVQLSERYRMMMRARVFYRHASIAARRLRHKVS